MLLNVRENLKKKWVFGIIIVVMAVMVMTGMGSINLASFGQDSVSEVGGEKISAAELQRAMNRRRAQLEAQGEDPSSPRMELSALRAEVLPSLRAQKALVAAGRDSGLGVSEQLVNDTIRSQTDFHVDGKFDITTYRRLLNQAQLTAASYKDIVRDNLFIQQQLSAISQSSIASASELRLFAKAGQEQRKFFDITIPQGDVEKTVAVSDEEIQSYYDENPSEFQVPTKVSVKYIEVSLDDIASTISVSEDEIKERFDAELRDFATNSQYEIAHILVTDDNDEKVQNVQARLNAGTDFAQVAKELSDDPGSKTIGGSLGVMTADTYPEAFENAVTSLEEGEVSAPVKTDAGMHFIKLVKKTSQAPPAFEERKAAIELALKRSAAEEDYIALITKLSDVAFEAPNLESVAQEAGVDVKTSTMFERDKGDGIASEQKVRSAAFSSEVLEDDRNSPVIEISNSQAVVLRKETYKPEHVADLETVKLSIVASLKSTKTQELLASVASELQDKIAAGENPEDLAKAKSFEFKQHELTDRRNIDMDFLVLRELFQLPAPAGDSISFSSVQNSQGDRVLIGLQKVQEGSVESYTDAEKNAIESQLSANTSAHLERAYQRVILNEYGVSSP